MPIDEAPAANAARKLVPTAAESSNGTQAGRIRLSKALAARPAAKPSGLEGAKPTKPMRVVSRCKLPAHEHEQLAALKKRLLALGIDIKKSQLLRAGLMLLVAMNDVQLRKSVADVEFTTLGSLPENAN